jgi:hypothetical protein
MVILEPKAGEFDKMLEWVNTHTMYGHSNCHSGIDEQIITEWTTLKKSTISEGIFKNIIKYI